MPSLKGGRKRQMKRRRMRGGSSTSSNGGGGADWVTKNFGNGQAQWDNTFGPNSLTKMGNLLPTVQGAPAVLAQNIAQGTYPAWTPMNLSGGSKRSRRRGRGRTKRRRGGAGFLATAAVPAALVAMNHYYSPSSSRGRFSRSRRGSRRGRGRF